MDPIFRPPLHRQRHQFVIDFVMRNKPKKVIDLGCGECSLLKKLRFHREIELLVGVDINGAKIKKKMHVLAPISTDYLQPSNRQLRIEMYQGSVTQRDARLRGFDLVTGIELIEHLTLADVELFSAVVFGYMAPATVIVSTPNSEFNPLLPGLSGFRHNDHKFEWSRAEFRAWAMKVCLEHGYEVEFTGVGQAPQSQQDSVGFCSQIGVFHHLGGREHCNMLCGSDTDDVSSYTLLFCITYPSLQDNTTLQRVLVNEVLYSSEQLKNKWMEKTSQRSAEDVTSPVEQCLGVVSDSAVQECYEVFWMSGQKQKEPCALNRFVCVPLAVLWSCCPKIRDLSGSVGHLRHLLMDEPKVKLSQDCSAVLVKYQEQDQEDEVNSDLEDSCYPEDSQCSHSAEQEEDWETDV
ncbi:small RNA 2'-O-methyltransferase [Melanotaenia boesemani]|uniref:small RNA 2'-O-methyltransferase n=1 Tax=Melanotaenia boesemani TaxID=1250792 RepID=UPI001C04DFEF|nr:small RNA 2'-O-methyltransferase [Melanotaenia boesemani]